MFDVFCVERKYKHYQFENYNGDVWGVRRTTYAPHTTIGAFKLKYHMRQDKIHFKGTLFLLKNPNPECYLAIWQAFHSTQGVQDGIISVHHTIYLNTANHDCHLLALLIKSYAKYSSFDISFVECAQYIHNPRPATSQAIPKIHRLTTFLPDALISTDGNNSLSFS